MSFRNSRENIQIVEALEQVIANKKEEDVQAAAASKAKEVPVKKDPALAEPQSKSAEDEGAKPVDLLAVVLQLKEEIDHTPKADYKKVSSKLVEFLSTMLEEMKPLTLKLKKVKIEDIDAIKEIVVPKE